MNFAFVELILSDNLRCRLLTIVEKATTRIETFIFVNKWCL